jgi:hypothetical protein
LGELPGLRLAASWFGSGRGAAQSDRWRSTETVAKASLTPTIIGKTSLGEKPVPPVDEIAAMDEFTPTIISSREFEQVWRRATRA